jgi:hypothetical protein
VPESPGRAAYVAYWAALTGRPGSDWLRLGACVRDAWEAAAKAVVEAAAGRENGHG